MSIGIRHFIACWSLPKPAIFLRDGRAAQGSATACETGLVAGTVAYEPDPIDPPAEGNVLICCSRPQGDVVIDL